MKTAQHNLPRLDNGELQSFAWPGGYPIYYLDTFHHRLCPDCANNSEREYRLDLLADLCSWCLHPEDTGFFFDARERPVCADINYEDNHLYCDDCSRQIESAYGDES